MNEKAKKTSPLPQKLTGKKRQSKTVRRRRTKSNGDTTPPGDKALRLQSFLDASSEGIALLKNGVIVDCNNQLGELLGYEQRDLRGKLLAQFLESGPVPDSGEQRQTEKDLTCRRLVRRKDGSLVSVEMREKSYGGGVAPGQSVAVREITDRSRAEHALFLERNLLRTLIDNLPDLIFFKDVEGRYLLNNRAHLTSIGAKGQEEALGKTTFDFNPPEFAAAYARDENEVMRSGKAMAEKEERALHYDTGEVRWHLTSRVPLVDSRGAVTGIVGIARDITERKKTEEVLEHERNQLRTLIDNLPDLIFFKDAEGHYILNNRAHLASIGAERQEDVLGKTTFEFNPPEHAAHYSEDEMAVIRTGKGMFDREETALHRDTGEERWHLTSKVPLIDAQGRVTGIVGIARDITAHKKAEAERERLIAELQNAHADLKTLSGLVPICANCKKIRDDSGFWTHIEHYIQERSEARFSHGICPDCMKKLYPNLRSRTGE